MFQGIPQVSVMAYLTEKMNNIYYYYY